MLMVKIVFPIRIFSYCGWGIQTFSDLIFMTQNKKALSRELLLLTYKDSNLNKQNQNLMCYRYTIGQLLLEAGAKIRLSFNFQIVFFKIDLPIPPSLFENSIVFFIKPDCWGVPVQYLPFQHHAIHSFCLLDESFK